MPQDINLANLDDERISPATEDLQRELLTELSKLSKATNDIKYQALTLAAASVVAQPEVAHGCKSVKFWTALSDLYVGDSISQPVLIVASIWNEIPVNNTSLLRFKSATGGSVYLISSN